MGNLPKEIPLPQITFPSGESYRVIFDERDSVIRIEARFLEEKILVKVTKKTIFESLTPSQKSTARILIKLNQEGRSTSYRNIANDPEFTLSKDSVGNLLGALFNAYKIKRDKEETRRSVPTLLIHLKEDFLRREAIV